MTTFLWMAAIRESGKFVPLNVSENKADVIYDAMINTRIAVIKADLSIAQQYFSEGYQKALFETRAFYGLEEEDRAQCEEDIGFEDEDVLGYGVTLKTKEVFFTDRPERLPGSDYEHRYFNSLSVAKSAAEKYAKRYSGRMDTLWSG